MTSLISTSLFPLEIGEILGLHFACFEAAMKAYRPVSVREFTISPDKVNDRRVYRIWVGSGRGSLPVDAPEKLIKAYIFWNKCDIFCHFPFEALKASLQQIGAVVEWETIQTKSGFLFVVGKENSKEPEEVPQPYHSVLTVVTRDKKAYYLDRTATQYGLDKKSWLLDEDSFWKQHDGWAVGTVTDIKFKDKWDMYQADDGYWGWVFDSFWGLFRSICSGEWASLTPATRMNIIREEAERRAEWIAQRTWG